MEQKTEASQACPKNFGHPHDYSLRGDGKCSYCQHDEEASQAVDERAVEDRSAWTFKQWYEHVGAWETPEGWIAFGSPMAVRAMMIQYGCTVSAALQKEARDAALKAQPAPTEAASDRVPMPKNADQAELMQKLGLAWLQTNAPERLTDAGRSAQGEDSARLDAERDVLAERRRQVEVEGWSLARDDRYNDCQLATAAATYALCTEPNQLKLCGVTVWPWSAGWWKPTTYRNNLVKAGTLILAEIERIDRARASAETGGVK